ncbi:MAG: cyclase family protein, partial [Methylobacteriaceae bacterium]|nr:cyclase family protein [Methylobacteriaceae bacterium]
MTHSIKARLGKGPPLGVLWVAIGSPGLAEIAGRAGPDAVVLDLQHGTWERATLESAIGLVRPVPVLVRTADASAAELGRALDAGAEGVIVPLVETAAEAAEIVAACRFPPAGTRSGGGVRPLSGDFVRYCEEANTRVLVGVMIETVRGVGNAAAIAATPGIDLVFIGTGDLALSLGCFPQVDARHEAACASVREACRAAGTPCGIFTTSADSAAERAAAGYDLVVVANDVGTVAGGFGAAVTRFTAARRSAAPALPLASSGSSPMSVSLLADLAAALASGSVEVVDLTQPLSPKTPVIQLPPPMAPSAPFSVETISRYDEGGPAWYWNNISMGEHTGTHFDAPAHWITGKDYPQGYTDTLPPSRFVAPACVID